MDGAEPSDNPDESAVEGRASASTESFLEVGFLRVGTPSGQVHCGQDGVREIFEGENYFYAHLADHGSSGHIWASIRHTACGLELGRGEIDCQAHLDLLNPAGQTTCLASRVFWPLALAGLGGLPMGICGSMQVGQWRKMVGRRVVGEVGRWQKQIKN